MGKCFICLQKTKNKRLYFGVICDDCKKKYYNNPIANYNQSKHSKEELEKIKNKYKNGVTKEILQEFVNSL